MTSDIFPSYFLEPKKVIDSIIWWLNPIEKPPQRFLHISFESKKNQIFSDLLEKDDYYVKHLTFNANTSIKAELEKNQPYDYSNKFNIVFSLANEKILDRKDLQTIAEFVNKVLKPSSYFIYELKIQTREQLAEIERIFLEHFYSVNFLVPMKIFTTSPFSPFDVDNSKYCWIAALTHSTDEDPSLWMDEFF